MVRLTLKLQTIFYEDEEGNLGKYITGEKERVTLTQAKEILEEQGISYETVFQVRREDVDLEMTNEKLQEMIVK